jgi:hypothetical protein
LELEVGAKLAAPPLTAGARAGRRRRVGSAADEAEVAGTGAGGAPEEESSRSSDDDEVAALCAKRASATPEGAAAAAQGGGVGGPGEYGNMLVVDSRVLFETAKAHQEQRRTVGRPPAVASMSTGFTVVTSGPELAQLGKTSCAKVAMEW